jgi:hypothetical protein
MQNYLLFSFTKQHFPKMSGYDLFCRFQIVEDQHNVPNTDGASEKLFPVATNLYLTYCTPI